MTADDLRALLVDFATEMRRYVEATVAKSTTDLRVALLAEIAAVQAIPGPPGPPGERGAPAEFDPEMLKALVEALPRPRDGEKGEVGPAGIGEKGADGKDGNRIAVGHGSPTLTAGLGDLYIDVKSGDLYEWR